MFSLLFSVPALAASVVISPIDSRPVSNSYLEKLVKLNNDTLITVPQEYLDIFTADTEKFADSASVRKAVRENVKNASSKDTTVIINASSYFTGGLIGSRCASQYQNTDEALKELLSLVTDYPQPKYYVNIAMPRNLPESRGQEIWPDDEKIKGLGAFYLEYNPECDDFEKISESFSLVTPTQFLMEYGYVFNKKVESSSASLMPWEKDFLDYCDKNYVNNSTYGQYIKNYIMPFEETSKICDSLLRWQRAGKIDEIIIGNDDLQLPESISYFYSQGASWVPLENSTPVKYSFSRTYMNIGINSVKEKMKRSYGEEETQKALEGKGESINFIFGMDEIPQLIYARSVAQRNGYCADMDIINYNSNAVAADYDVLAASSLAQNALNFVSSNLDSKGSKCDIFVYDYSSGSESDKEQFITKLDNSITKGNNASLVELYTYQTISSGNNYIFKELLDNSINKDKISGITDLTSFSAWNTNANALGLGIAHSEVYMLSSQKSTDIESFAQNQTNILLQHVFDDGIYYGQLREEFTKQGYVPSKDEINQSAYLVSALDAEKVLNAFKGMYVTANGKSAVITGAEIEKAAFPWQRLFDCQIETNCSANEIQLN